MSDRPSLVFEVPGRPVPKGRPRVFVQHGRQYARTPDKTVAFERLVGIRAASKLVREKWPMDARYWLNITVYVADTKSSKARKLDLDNVLKSISDGLNGVAWGDDASVDWLTAKRVRVSYGTAERTDVAVSVLPPQVERMVIG